MIKKVFLWLSYQVLQSLLIENYFYNAGLNYLTKNNIKKSFQELPKKTTVNTQYYK